MQATDSEAGSRFVERMFSVVATARQQNRKVLELLTACCRARLDDPAAHCFTALGGRTGGRLDWTRDQAMQNQLSGIVDAQWRM